MTTKKTFNSTLTLAATALAGTMAFSGAASADANPFGLTDLSSGYQVAMEGKCGGDKAKGDCGEGKCGGDKAKGEGKCGGDKAKSDAKGGEGKCGEGKCGGKK